MRARPGQSAERKQRQGKARGLASFTRLPWGPGLWPCSMLGRQREKTMMHLTRRHLLATSAAGLAAAIRPAAADPAEVKIALLVPLSGAWGRFGVTMREGAELGVADVNAAGGVKALGGAKLKLMVFDAGDSAEKAKEAAQRMVADQPDLVAASGAYLSTFTLAATEVTERAELPMLTLSYSDLITNRGFRYVFQTSSRGDDQANESIPALLKLAEQASGKRPQTIGIVTDNTGASISFVKPL